MLSLAVACLLHHPQTTPVPTMNELYKFMFEAIRRERGYEDEVIVHVDGSEVMKFSRSVDGDKFRYRQWRGTKDVFETGYDGATYYAINFATRAYWNYGKAKKDFPSAFKTVAFQTKGQATASLRYENSLDFWLEANPNPRVLSVRPTELDDQPARLVKVVFGGDGDASQEASLYFEKDRWILLRAEATALGPQGNQMLIAVCKVKRGIVFEPSTFQLDLKRVVGLTKKSKDDS